MIPRLRVRLTYHWDTWAGAPDGGRAANPGMFRAVLDGFPGCQGYGWAIAEAVEALAADLIAHVDAEGYRAEGGSDSREKRIEQLIADGELVEALAAACDEPLLRWDPPPDP